jgi:hypothetical protein
MSTLLGPEGMNTLCVFVVSGCQAWPVVAYRSPWVRVVFWWWGGVWWLWVVGWSFVENCTVDASIFVVKLSRANGGCLGTRSR